MKIKITCVRKFKHPDLNYRHSYEIFYKLSNGRRYNYIVDVKNETVEEGIKRHLNRIREIEHGLKKNFDEEKYVKKQARKVFKELVLREFKF